MPLPSAGTTESSIWTRVCEKDLDRTAIADAATVYVSAASAWEVAIKIALGRLHLVGNLLTGWVDGEFFPLAFTDAAVQKVTKYTLVLRPGATATTH